MLKTTYLLLGLALALGASDMTDETYQSVKRIFEKEGARVERAMSTPKGRTVRIYLPARTAAGMTKTQAETLAASAWSRLGDNAIVYIKGPGGNTLGKASP